MDFGLSTLTAHLYNVVVRGNESPDAAPLFRVDKLTVGLKIQSVLQRKVNLSELLIEHPVVHIEVSSEGRSNVPQPSPSQSSSLLVIGFGLGVQALVRRRFVSTAATVNLHTSWYVGS